MNFVFRMSFFALVLLSLSAIGQEQSGLRIDTLDSLKWEERAPGVWSARVGEPPELSYRELAGAPPQVEALGKFPTAALPFESNSGIGGVHNGRAQVRLPLGEEEQLYGFGLEFRGLHRRSEVYHLHVDHHSGTPGRTHAPVPFYVSSAGYGVLFNVPRYVSVYAGIGNRPDGKIPTIRDRNTDPAWPARPKSDAVEASAQSPGMEVLVFAGPTPLDAVRRYNLYFGGGALPPKWALGFWHRVPTNATADEVLAEVAEFERRDFPLSVIGLEPGWHTKSYPCTFDWNPKNFPDPRGFVQELSGQGVRVNLWENPYVSPDSSIYQKILPYTGSHTVWLGVIPDYTLPAARQVLTEQHARAHLDIGVSGYKIDEVDGIDAWLWPDHAVFPSGRDGETMRQVYGLQLQQMLQQMFRERNERTFGLVRGTNAGASAYPFALYSDSYNHRGYVTALANSGFAGVLWTPEIRDARNPDDWVRRMQTACLSPIAQLNAWASKTKPWSVPEADDAIRAVMKLRMRLLPYLYTTFAQYREEGTPPYRALALDYPDYNVAGTDEAYSAAMAKGVTDQFMLGEAMMVAPLFGSDRERDVVLPPGRWYDFYTGEFVGSGTVVKVSAPLERIPLFVKDGGCIPLGPEVNRMTEIVDTIPLEVRHYGEARGSGWLYDDDGETFDYEQGESAWFRLESNGSQGTVQRDRGDFEPTFGNVRWRFMTESN